MLVPRSTKRITSGLWHLGESQEKGWWSDIVPSKQLFGPVLTIVGNEEARSRWPHQ